MEGNLCMRTVDGSANSWLGLEGKVCAVTGAASGIGAEIARRLANAGAPVALLDRDFDHALEVTADIERSGGQAVAISCDVADKHNVERAAVEVERTFGPCEVLVNNAATLYPGAIMDADLDRWRQLMDVNIGGYLLCAQIFGRQMMAVGGGSMVHVGSLSGQVPQAFSGPYSVSKAGVAMLSRLLAVELGDHHIRSNLVSPGMVRTAMTEMIYRDPVALRKREAIVPARRIGSAPDLAEVVLFLASKRSAYINGQDIVVDGGLSTAWLTLVPRPGFERTDAAAEGESA
ncbi:SDR family NAD(P)-dependent oxidoreductase [Sphingobium sp. HWE2-09]|uniref:SDR family NAD(P)-dependent oxidoreductase n=1 Tax=Sphingobium sp. HWE2-09 TaxID=3108390 RepID=UPI002DCE9248|nr:SDR family oxidoreductase [Sphingobium sp. HWE2-09]